MPGRTSRSSCSAPSWSSKSPTTTCRATASATPPRSAAGVPTATPSPVPTPSSRPSSPPSWPPSSARLRVELLHEDGELLCRVGRCGVPLLVPDLLEVVAHVLHGEVGVVVPRRQPDEEAGNTPGRGGVDLTRDRALLVGQPRHQRRHQLGVDELDHGAEDLLGHT